MKRKKTDNPYRKEMWQLSKSYWEIFLCSFLVTFASIVIPVVMHLDVFEGGQGGLGIFWILYMLPAPLALLGFIPYILRLVRLNKKAKEWRESPVKQTNAQKSPFMPASAESKAKVPHADVQEDRIDVLSLLNLPPSHGDAILNTLELRVEDGKPTLFWCVTWRGGYSHADGAGGCLPIPESVLRGMSADSLVDWISDPRFMVDDTDLSPFKKDTRVIAWCDAHRLRSDTKLLQYEELFVTESFDSQHYAAVIIDRTTNLFYNALFTSVTQGGNTAFSLENTGSAIPVEKVRELAQKSTDSRAEEYIYWKEDR